VPRAILVKWDRERSQYPAAVTDNFIEQAAEPSRDWKQVIAAIILGVAATLTAVAAYNAALADGEALEGYTNSMLLLNDANAFYAQGNVTVASDQDLFIEYAVAAEDGREDIAAYLTTLMRPELQEALDWWLSTDEAVTPFDDAEENPYAVPDFEQANDLEAQAQTAFAEGADADERGDQFELAAVLFALALFFGGIATLFARAGVTTALLVMAGFSLIFGVARLITAL
jgi:hypothetical protein